MSADYIKITQVRVTTDTHSAVLVLDGLKEDQHVVLDVPREVAHQLALDLIAAGFGPAQRGGHA
ncbi:hypothetical protein [Tardiphaga sp.]|jgi:hypothetical protein|uniref:hypothetical protein n=1 Tax=Tardiphaga sp. TaxID=1926292 RepID=UPI0037D9CFA2